MCTTKGVEWVNWCYYVARNMRVAPGAALKEWASNHYNPRRQRARVVSVMEKAELDSVRYASWRRR